MTSLELAAEATDEDVVLANVQLHLALCAKRCEQLWALLQRFETAAPPARSVLLAQVGQLVPHMPHAS